ncbi:HlyD family type I secretion periplasmic adaptor subunit (plasmid) [Skermanella mucosa]|uniref:HlyD family type I secretion periplasmic adaptor subunit n=1 Tax=Skermanella mucosa TaxID=1789672 RepID=UPI00192C9E4F|nr:HlyD family type I secretion periplasmic adaptor subunit [Skermanella mucosa]UEM24580.1 HlyD family type I secretion periplasmic adaptor subunit [Skermanella mucosa]
MTGTYTQIERVKDSPPDLQPRDAVVLRRTIRRPVWLGFAMMGIFALGFGVWGTVAPLAKGAVAAGVISPEGSRRTVQHLEGGIISRLRVQEGDTVRAGQILVSLEDIQPRAIYEGLLDQYLTLYATQVRLSAEEAGRDRLDWPVELQGPADTENLRAIIESQKRLFETRRVRHISRRSVLQQRIALLWEQIKGLEAQVQSTSTQLALIAEEIAGKQVLRNKELIPKPELLRMQRAEAEILGMRGEYLAEIASAKQQIGESEMQILALDAERADQIAVQSDEVRNNLAAVKERLFASRDTLKRTMVTAPVSGTILNLRYKTEGGVVHPGEPILDIVPSDDTLVIEARVSPVDIDVVQPGLTAQVHLSAFSSRTTPQIDGIVMSVSADRIIDDVTKQPFYLARVEVDRDSLRKVEPQIELVPGMPAEVLIVTGERTMMQYLLEPFSELFRRSFREV